MERENYYLKNNLIARQALDNLYEAITQHKWKDALVIFPTIIPFMKFNISPFFMWKTLHLLMINRRVPLGIQAKILTIFFKSKLPNHEMAIDWLANYLEEQKEEDVEKVHEACAVSLKVMSEDVYINAIYKAFYALYFYIKWKKFHLQFESPDVLVKERGASIDDLSKECLTDGRRAYFLLKAAMSFLESSFNVYKNKAERDMCKVRKVRRKRRRQGLLAPVKKEEKKEVFLLVYEWLLDPFLDIEEYVFSNEKQETGSKRYKSKEFRGLSIVQNYVQNRRTHLPSLRFYYNYVTTNFSDKKELIKSILEDIVSISPDSSLVINYVECQDFIRNVSQSFQSEEEDCLLAGNDIDLLMKCLELLSKYVEHKVWWTDFRAWNLIVKILEIFHISWVNCWVCSYCEGGIQRIENFVEELDSWPKLFMNTSWLKQIPSTDTELAVSLAYISFILGYQKELTDCVMKRLFVLERSEELKTLTNLMIRKGSHSRDLIIHLGKLRKKRFGSLSGSSESISSKKRALQYDTPDKVQYIGIIKRFKEQEIESFYNSIDQKYSLKRTDKTEVQCGPQTADSSSFESDLQIRKQTMMNNSQGNNGDFMYDYTSSCDSDSDLDVNSIFQSTISFGKTANPVVDDS